MASCEIVEARTATEKAGLLDVPAFPVSSVRCFSIHKNGKQIARAIAIPVQNGLELHLDSPEDGGNGVFKAFKRLVTMLVDETGCNRLTTYCAVGNIKARIFIRALNFQPIGAVNGNQWYELFRWQIA